MLDQVSNAMCTEQISRSDIQLDKTIRNRSKRLNGDLHHYARISCISHQLRKRRSDSLCCQHLMIMTFQFGLTSQVSCRKEYIKDSYTHSHKRPIQDGEIHFMRDLLMISQSALLLHSNSSSVDTAQTAINSFLLLASCLATQFWFRSGDSRSKFTYQVPFPALR